MRRIEEKRFGSSVRSKIRKKKKNGEIPDFSSFTFRIVSSGNRNFDNSSFPDESSDPSNDVINDGVAKSDRIRIVARRENWRDG